MPVLTHKLVQPGSAQHRALIDRTNHLGRLLYPDLYARRDAEHDVGMHRRACAAIASAATRVHTKQDPPAVSPTEGSTTVDLDRGPDGCNAECA